MRRFTTPSGGTWAATLCRLTRISPGGGSSLVISASVLRFTSPDGTFYDLADYPATWMAMDDAGLVSLLRIAAMAARTSETHPTDPPRSFRNETGASG